MASIKVTVIKRDNSDNYYARWTDPVTFRERRKSTKTKIKRDAERFALRLEKEINEGSYYDQSKTKWADFKERYETEVMPGFAIESVNKAQVIFRHVESIINPNLLIQVDADAISKMVKDLRETGLEEVTIKGYLIYIKSALNWAHSIGMLPSVPNFPKFKRIREEKAMRGRPLCLEELERMLEAVPSICGKDQAESWRFHLRGLWCSGLRLAESLDLYWDREDKLSIDLTGKRPMLRIRMESEKGNKDRLLPIVPEFAALLQEVPEDERTGPVFNPQARKKRAERMLPSTISKQIADIGEKANVVVGDKGNIDKETGKRKPRYASAHDLRRSFGERWSLKVMPDVLMLLMRHSDIDTTMKYYIGRNAQKAADVIWGADADSVTNLVTSDQNAENVKPSKQAKACK
ncbi:site-specific integrase [uncultured Gimesia sp.]|mgnify:CR=1 FL=1|jgi:integrase|uniref:tyrosine-type recombinase/integrase n=1 Tax=uncultured Gimesia sp. TaxID=1678688 RepID=UPI0026037396|nr:site-specific integrase [uncultured Gimesia sp.]